MSHSALINIDSQVSFFHRDYWDDTGFADFQMAISRLIAGCQKMGVRWSISFTLPTRAPFRWRPAMLNPCLF